MSDIVKWSGHGGISFFVKPNEIRGFKDLSISAAAETKDSTKDGEKYIQKKNSGSYVIQLTAVLSAALKVDVKDIATAITEAARSGETGYFYTGNTKLFPSSFMATEAKISNIRMNGSGVWTYCEVTWTLKQCSKYGASSSSSSSSGKKKKNKSTTASWFSAIATGIKTAAETILLPKDVKAAVKSTLNITSDAKKQSAAVLADANKKKSGVGGGGNNRVLVKQ